MENYLSAETPNAIAVRRSEDRGAASFGWLKSRHTFSFGYYYDPAFMGFGPLQVINEDRVEPGRGFDTHGHRDMEIISYVLGGALEHRDDMGNGSVLSAGDVQRAVPVNGQIAPLAQPLHLLRGEVGRNRPDHR